MLLCHLLLVRVRTCLGWGVVCCALLVSAPLAQAQSTIFKDTKPVNLTPPTPSENQPVALEADNMGYDQKRQIVLAKGNVEVVQGDYILRADKMTYFQTENIVRADGNVSVLQPNGEVYFADHVELTGDMKVGTIEQFRARLADSSVFAANEATRVNPALTTMKEAVYSPCKLCKNENPFWQVKAKNVKIDNIAEKVTYDDAQLEFAGVPVFYTPYFSHATPDAGAVSGFLTPEYSQSDNLGTTIKTPYYVRLAPDKELTLTPWYTSDEGALLQTDYNQKTDGGLFSVESSMTYPEKLNDAGQPVGGNSFRGHIFARGEQSLTDYSRLGFDVQRTTDDTYLRRYGFGSQFSLTSRGYAEAAQGRNFALAEAMAFQGLRIDDDSSTTPRILPSLTGYYETEPTRNGARFHVAGNTQNLTRPEGSTYQRAIVSTGASIPYVTENGQVLEAEANIRGDVYSISDAPVTNNGIASTFDGQKTRAIPQAALTWRYPLIARMEDASVTVEPVIVGVAQPRGGNPQEIPNEDNRVVELTDTNLFSTNRMPGYDTVDSGSRVAYGVRSQMQFAGGQSVDGLFGQNYNADETPFPNARRLGDELSDYIGRVGLDYAPITLSYRFALDQETLSTNRNEIWAGYSNTRLSLTGVYLNVEDSPYVSDSEEALSYAQMKLDDEWSLFGNGRRDLNENKMISAAGGVIFQNECFSLLTQMQRAYTRDRDIEPSTDYSFRVGFKNFGEFGNR